MIDRLRRGNTLIGIGVETAHNKDLGRRRREGEEEEEGGERKERSALASMEISSNSGEQNSNS